MYRNWVKCSKCIRFTQTCIEMHQIFSLYKILALAVQRKKSYDTTSADQDRIIQSDQYLNCLSLIIHIFFFLCVYIYIYKN